jgi:hypothetical protein
MELTCVDLDFKDALGEHFDDRMMTTACTAVPTCVYKQRRACHNRGC